MPLVKIERTKEKQLVHLKLNFVEKRNILSLEMIQDLTEAIESLSQDSDIKLVILSGSGRHFCAGGDLKWMLLKENCSDIENLNQVQILFKMYQAFYQFPLPIIGRVQGSVFGGALGLAALCDIVLADKNSRFCFSEIKLALIPALIAPWVLKKMPAGKVRELMLSGRVFESKEALDWGLVHFEGERKDCEERLNQIIQQFLSYDSVALKQIKKLLNAMDDLSETERNNYSLQALAERRKSPEVSKRIQKFFKARELKKTAVKKT